MRGIKKEEGRVSDRAPSKLFCVTASQFLFYGEIINLKTKIKTNNMREYTFIYTDWCGRSNQASRFAENQEKATEKFKLLYPNTYILDVE